MNVMTMPPSSTATCPTWCVEHDDADLIAHGTRLHCSAQRRLPDVGAELWAIGFERYGVTDEKKVFVNVNHEYSVDELRALALELTAYADRIDAA